FHLALDQVRDDFSVGFGDEAMALALQLRFQIEVVLDDAVVNDDDLAGAVAMGMRILFGRPAVCRPACVADTVVAANGIGADRLFEIGQFPGASPQIHRPVANHCDAGGVVAAIFQSPQPVNQDRDDFFRSDVADDPAHALNLVGPHPHSPTRSRRKPLARRYFFFLRPSTQPSMFRCLPALTARAPGGTSSRTVVPLPTYAPFLTVTGAMSCVSLPINAPSSMVVWFFLTPS